VDWFDASTAAAASTMASVMALPVALPGTLPVALPVVVPGAVIVSSWTGYAQADPTLVGVVVAAIAIFSVVYVLKRVLGERRPGRRSGPTPGSRSARERSR
jgi:ABC-type uncharacterized transport system permease subunit